jgi:hypothetical protein
MESLQFVGCSWFMGLIGLVFRFTQNKFTETEHVCDPAPPLSLLDYTRCPRGSQLSSSVHAHPTPHRGKTQHRPDRHASTRSHTPPP